MKVKVITKPYRLYNEDGIVITPHCWCVLDGATTLFEDQSNQTSSLASRLVAYVEIQLPKLLNQNVQFKDAIDQLSIDAYKHFNFKTSEPARLPSMGIAAVVETNKYYELYLLGDVAISYKTISGLDYRFTDTSLNKLDDEIISLMHKENKTRKEVMAKLIENRNKLGIDYQAFIPSLNPEFKFRFKRILKSNIKEIRLYTDGFYSLRDTFKQVKNHKEFMDYKLDDAVEMIESLAYQDSELKTFPRLKVIDDITVLQLQTKPKSI